MARLNRNFLHRVVRYSLDQGIRQFLDLGSGIPTVGNTHQIADSAGVDARVVYVDDESVAYHHSRGLLDQNPNATIIQTDMREQEVVFDHPETRRLLDFNQPVALLVVEVLLYLPDPQPIELIRGYRQHLEAGSLIAVSTLTDEHADPALREEVQRLRAAYAEAGEPVHPRDHAEISPWFEGLALVEPGLVPLPEWRSTDLSELTDVAGPLGYGAVARVP